ncbi:DUF7660 family protein [Hymenobacter pini]|uniref:DUF7660 family protein n=1 Tax=Hymenobacter pini TaxID=2880879 RepID=UPI001CF2E287|nr:hypothetical protein [Hymenobacter pini]MCA8829594.1 hypothetical protein [Hymenobacter pini]
MPDFLTNMPVNSRADFAKFLILLHQDLLTNPHKWENQTLERFLEAMAAYAEDIQGFYDNTRQPLNADEPTWQNFTNILRGASVYE